MTSALPPSIWWERPPSFWNLRGCAPAAGAATGRPAAVCAGAGGRALLAGHRAHRPRATRATSATTERQDGGPDAKQRATDPF